MEIKGKVHCFFEQSGTFKNEFIKLGIPAEDYDIQNNFEETDHVTDLFKAIEDAYDDKPSIFDGITNDDLIMAFFPCIYFSDMSEILHTWGAYPNKTAKVATDAILSRSAKRQEFYELCIDLAFNEPMIPYGDFADDEGKEIVGETTRKCWEALEPGDQLLSDAYQRLWGKRNLFTWVIAYKDKILPTFTAHQESVTPIHKPMFLSQQEQCCGSTFPQDYDFGKESPYYICGMSVPPVMMAQVASRIYEQWLSKIKDE